MKRAVFLLAFLFVVLNIEGQTITRKEVKGEVYALSNDVESITIFNTSSNVGTITNDKGEFILDVAKNDIIQVSALQFEAISITITDEVVKSGKLKIYLVEQIHKLDAVLLSSGLTGNVSTDIENIAYLKPIILNMGSMNVDFEYNDDKAFDETVVQSHLKSLTSKGELYNGFDLGKISNLIFGKKDKKYKKPNYVSIEKPLELVDVYSYAYISEIFEIPLDQVEDFIAFIDTQDLDETLLKKDNEIKCLQFLYEKSKLFLKNRNEKK